MQGDTTAETGWAFVADNDEVATIINTALTMEEGETYSRSELAEMTGIALKTLHLMDDVEHVVELGILEKHQSEGEEVAYSVNEDSTVLEKAREFGDAVTAAQSD
ncbi:hypothetical protein ACFR9U_10725 [Halorientalis brevis]|uniref:Uncharacterized protein n=1 Tax=Halorientalis brevis TaxID=1126241 RepID=A0ABD6CB31_9EURY|nr:hypothetical protein [Halorientalis brevis]